MSYAFLDISIGRAPSNRVIIELFDKIAPETCHFFKSLLSSSPGYKSTLFTRIIEDFMIQGGDVPEEASLNCPSEMENPTYPVDKPGLVGMARTSAAEKNAQFFITLVEAQHLNGQHTIFGKVVKGMEVVDRIGGVEVDDEDKPVEGSKVLIVGVGSYSSGRRWKENLCRPKGRRNLWRRIGRGVCPQGGMMRLEGNEVDRRGRISMNRDGGVRLEMGNGDIVTTIITTDIIDGPSMVIVSWTRTMRTGTLNVPNVIQSTMTVMQTHPAEIQHP